MGGKTRRIWKRERGTKIRIYYVRNESIFNKMKKGERKMWKYE